MDRGQLDGQLVDGRLVDRRQLDERQLELTEASWPVPKRLCS